MSERTVLTEEEIREILEDYPGLPMDYLDYMRGVGWGVAENGYMIFEGPIIAPDIFTERFDREGIVLFGSDHCGYCFRYDLINQTADQRPA